MLKVAMKMRARAAESEKKTAAAAAEGAAEPREPPPPGDAEKPAEKSLSPVREAPSAPLLTEKERKKREKRALEQRRKEEKKREKERKKLEKMLRKKQQGPAAPETAARSAGPEEAAAAEPAAAGAAVQGAGGADEGAAGGGAASRAWAEWDADSGEEDDDAYYAAPRLGGIVWRPGPRKAGALSAHLPLVVFLVFSVRSPSWVLHFLLPRRPEQGRGCGFVFGATCCFRVFLGCAFFSYLGGRGRRRARGRPGDAGARRRGRDEQLP